MHSPMITLQKEKEIEDTNLSTYNKPHNIIQV
jgi:hypothetical protein